MNSSILFLCFLIADRHSGRSGDIHHRGIQVGKALCKFKETASPASAPPAASAAEPPLGTVRYVMRGEAAADLKLVNGRGKIVVVPLLVGVAENKIERAFQGGNDIVRVAEACVDKLFQTRFTEVSE